LLAQIQIRVEDDDLKETMLGAITNQVGEAKGLETPKQCGVQRLDNLPMFKKTKKLSIKSFSKIILVACLSCPYTWPHT
jgi:hypothetical protein